MFFARLLDGKAFGLYKTLQKMKVLVDTSRLIPVKTSQI
jgi:hypothetical protein